MNVDHPFGAALVILFGAGAVVCAAITWWPIKKSGSPGPPSSASDVPPGGPDLSLSGPAGPGSSPGPFASCDGGTERVPLDSDANDLLAAGRDALPIAALSRGVDHSARTRAAHAWHVRIISGGDDAA